MLYRLQWYVGGATGGAYVGIVYSENSYVGDVCLIILYTWVLICCPSPITVTEQISMNTLQCHVSHILRTYMCTSTAIVVVMQYTLWHLGSAKSGANVNLGAQALKQQYTCSWLFEHAFSHQSDTNVSYWFKKSICTCMRSKYARMYVALSQFISAAMFSCSWINFVRFVWVYVHLVCSHFIQLLLQDILTVSAYTVQCIRKYIHTYTYIHKYM